MDYLIFFFIFIIFLILIIYGLPYRNTYYKNQIAELQKEVVRENFETSSKEDIKQGASTFFDWRLKESDINPDKCNTKKPEKSINEAKCLDDKKTYVQNDYYIYPQDKKPEQPTCSNCDALNCKNIDRYVLKSSVPPCPDLSNYALKSMIKSCPDLKDYVLKNSIPPCPDLKDYVLKNQIPACPDLKNYVLKSQIPTCPDLKNYVLKSQIQTCPDLKDYVLKSQIPACPNLPDLTKYILKSQIPACPKPVVCPTCPVCPKCPPTYKNIEDDPRFKNIIIQYQDKVNKKINEEYVIKKKCENLVNEYYKKGKENGIIESRQKENKYNVQDQPFKTPINTNLEYKKSPNSINIIREQNLNKLEELRKIQEQRTRQNQPERTTIQRRQVYYEEEQPQQITIQRRKKVYYEEEPEKRTTIQRRKKVYYEEDPEEQRRRQEYYEEEQPQQTTKERYYKNLKKIEPQKRLNVSKENCKNKNINSGSDEFVAGWDPTSLGFGSINYQLKRPNI